VVRKHSFLILTLSCFFSLVRSYGTHLADFLVRQIFVKYGEDGVNEAISHLGKGA
jgi:hypothetical protein